MDISAVIVELEDKAWTPNKPITLRARSSNASQGKSYGRRYRDTRDQKRNNYSSGQKKSLEIYLHFHTSRYSKSICYKQYPEKLPNSLKKIEQ